MDATTREMVLTAYDDTVSDSLGQGRDAATAHREGLVAASMCLAAMTGLEDEAARAELEGLKLGKA